jgi:hypothetical protein
MVGASLLSPGLAWAEPTEADRATARALAAEGYDALERHDYKIAEDRFRRADALVHAPTIVVDRARALVGLGRLVEAYESYQLVLREGVATNAPASWKQAAADAAKEVGTVERRLAWLVLRVEGPSEPNVTIDGVALPNASLGARRAIDPGRHNIRVAADGYVAAGRSVTLSEAQESEVTLTLEEAPPTEEQPQPVTEEPTQPSEQKRSPIPMWVAFGVGGAGLTFGAIMGGLALGAHAELSDECPNDLCLAPSDEEEARLNSDVKSYRGLAAASTVGFAVGAAGVITGFTLFFLNKGAKKPANTASVEPRIGLGSVGVEGRF